MYLCFPHTLLQRHQSSVKIGSVIVWEMPLYLPCLFWHSCSRQMHGRWDGGRRGWQLSKGPEIAGDKEGKSQCLWEESQLSQCSHFLERQVDQQMWGDGNIHICMCVHVCIYRTSGPGHLHWQCHKLPCPLLKQLNRRITFKVPSSKPRTPKITALAPGFVWTKPIPSAG